MRPATTTRPALAATARRHTWTIIGAPPMSTIGLPGRRVACMRAGMTMRVFGTFTHLSQR